MTVQELIDVLTPLKGDIEIGFILNNQDKATDIISLDKENGEDTILEINGYERKDIRCEYESFNIYLNMIDV